MELRVYNLAAPRGPLAVRRFQRRLAAGALTAAGSVALDVPGIVHDIIARVARQGDAALVELTARLDRVRLLPQDLRVPPERIAAARAVADRAFLDLIGRARENIRQYQQSIKHSAPPALTRGGRALAVRYTPVDRAGVYVPGGRAFYPSTVLMCVVPAQVAGVRQIALACPPTFDGDVHPLVLALAGELGIDEVYRVGGAQAVAALALGTATIRPVDKIVGPGNAFVAEAKRQLFGRVGIDSIAGPSEVLIIADDAAPAEWVAADLLAQVEHDPGVGVLVTPSAKLAADVGRAIGRQLPLLSRAKAIRALAGRNLRVILTADLDQACAIANDFAPEHLQIITRDDNGCLNRIRHAGAIFIGAHTPVPLGDYYAGPSHVLPTGRTARFFSPLSVNDFLKSSSVIRYDAASLAADAADVADFAAREGLTAHARAVLARRK